MTVESDLRDHLAGAGAVVALVGERITPQIREQGADLPAVSYGMFPPDPHNNLGGRDESLRAYRVQIDCWSRSYDEVMALAAAVYDRMNTATSTIKAQLIPYAGFDDYEPDTRIYRRSMDFRVWHKES